MAGMGIGAAAAGDAPEQAPQSPPEGQDDGPEPNVTPEEQGQYDEFVTNGMKLIYHSEGDNVSVAPAVLGQLRGQWDDVKPSLGEMPQEDKPLDPANPIDNLAVATVGLVLALEASAADASKQVDPSVLLHGAAELMEQLADIAEAAGIHSFTSDEMTGAANRTAMLYGVSSKTVNKQEAMAEFDHFLKSEGENLGQTLSEVAGRSQQTAEQEQPPEQGA